MKHAIIRQALALTVALFWTLLGATSAAFAQANTAFTYQGRLTDNSTLASGAYDLQFALFDAVSAGTQQGANVTLSNVSVTNGIFTVSLDFGIAPFAASAPRFLQIGVRPGGGSGTFTLLTPRQQLAPTPYAIRALTAATADTATNATNATNATTATNATQLGGLEASQYVTGSVVRTVNGVAGNITLAAGANVTLTPSGNTLTIAATGGTGGTGDFIQNTTTPQAASNFNISGNGTAGGTLSGNVVNAATQFNLGGNRVLAVSGAGLFANSNTFTGIGAGTNTTPNLDGFGINNSFFGNRAGAANTTGSSNTFVGYEAGTANTMGGGNAFFGTEAGRRNTTGNENAFFGLSAGNNNMTGRDNAFVGFAAGLNNTTGNTNAFVGAVTGFSNTTGSNNAFVGYNTGFFNTTGSHNAFFGTNTGNANAAGNNNTLIGSGANLGSDGLTFATALGAGAVVSTNNTLVLGRSTDTVHIPGAFSSSILSNPGTSNTLLGSGANVGSSGLTFATAIGAGAVVATSNTLVLGRGSDAVRTPGSLTVSGTLVGQQQVIAQGTLFANVGLTSGGAINANGGLNLNNTDLRLRNSSDPNHRIRYDSAIDGIEFRAFDQFRWIRTADNFEQMTLRGNGDLSIRGNLLSNSDGRYKTAVETLPQALAQVLRLRGVRYHWKPEFNRDPRRQLGFIAQEVEAVLPELVNTDDKGFKSVAYANVVPVLVEAVKEQQQQLDELPALKAENAALKAQLAALAERLTQLEQRASLSPAPRTATAAAQPNGEQQ